MFKEFKINLIILFASAIGIVLSVLFIENEVLKGILIGIIGSIIASPLYMIPFLLPDSKAKIRLYISILFKRADFIRFSIAYLYRIQIEDKYLLVRSNRIKDFFQPVGGAYKYFENAVDTFSKLGIRKDDKIKVDEKSDGDLRLQVPKKNVIKFLHWLVKNENREINCNREFYEELVATNILSKNNFPYVQYRKINEYSTGLKYSKHFQCWEILNFDIVEPVLNEAQKKELKELYTKGNSENYVWVDAISIENDGFNHITKEQEFRFGTQTKFII